MRLARRERAATPAARARAEQLPELPRRWHATQRLVLGRGEISLEIAAYLRRLAAIVERTRAQLGQVVQRDLVAPYAQLVAELEAFRDGVEAGARAPLAVTHALKHKMDPSGLMEALVRETQAATRELPEDIDTVPNDGLAQLESHPFEEIDSVSVGVQRLVEFIVEAELIGELSESAEAIPEHERRAHRLGRDVVRLVSYSASDLLGADAGEVDEDARAQLLPLLDSGIGRVRAELEQLEALLPALDERLAAKLSVIRERTDTWAIAGEGDSLDRLTKTRRGPLAKAAIERLQRAGRAIRGAVVGLVYRRSRGVLLARRLRPGVRASDAVVARALAMTRRSTPAAEVLAALPYYYRQLFLGRSASDHTFWVGREAELAQAARAIDDHRRGVVGALVVVGEGGSGKSALAQMIARTHFAHDRIFRLTPPHGGSVDPETFAERMRDTLQVRGTLQEALRTLPEGSTLLLEDLELWWERSPGGLAVIDLLLDVIERHGERCLFVLDLNTGAFRAIDRFRGLAQRALAVLECGPVDSRTLRAMIDLRHGSTGFEWELDGRAAGELSDWRKARFFAGLFDATRGVVGPALQSWLVHVDKLRGETLQMRQPKAVDDGVLDDLSVGQRALLVQLVLHKQLGHGRLATMTGLPAEQLEDQLGVLRRMGLITRDGEDVIALERYVQHLVTRHLEARGMLP